MSIQLFICYHESTHVQQARQPIAVRRPVVVRNEKAKDMKEKQELGITDATAAAHILRANESEHCAMDCSIYERSTRIPRTKAI